MQSWSTHEDSGEEQLPEALELVNERLEEAIEQLRLASEALQVTGHELATLNNQLEMMNEEMERLSQEVVRLRSGYVHTLNHVPYPVVLADEEGKIETWNIAARQLFHPALDGVVGIDLSEFPVQPSLGRALRRKHRAVMEGGTALMLSNQLVHVKRAIHRMDVHFTLLSRGPLSHGVLIAFVSSSAREKVAAALELSGNSMADSAAS
jgi:nitrogen fixation/metabolism regulation signal transduction histidine kinase